MQKLISSFFLSLFISIFCFGQDASKDFKTKSVSLFKNGTAFYLKTGKVKAEQGSYRMTQNIPSALFGTFWIQSPNGKLNSVSSFNDQVEETTTTRSDNFAHMLSANLGKKVKLYLGKKEEVIEGVVEEVEKVKQKKEGPLLPQQFIINNILTFRTDSSWLTISVSEIRRIAFLEKPKQILETKALQNKPVLQFDFTNQNATQQVDIMYLQNGLSWTPGYLIELIDEQKAALTLRAEVVNNAEDIEDTDINFVVGVPNFRFANRLSSLVDFYNQFVPAVNAGFSNSMRSQTTNAYAIESASLDDISAIANEVTGSAEEDLFFYNLKNFSLKKGGRGHYPIFNKTINIEHIYECNLTANNANQRYFQENFLFTPDNSNKVFHSVKVINDTDFPWTTGSAMVVKGTKDQKPISQDQLNYTPIKGHSFVKLTEAPDVKVKHAEREIARTDRAMKNPQNRKLFLDLVTIEGQLKIKNYKAKDIDLNIRRTITGKLESSTTKWLKAEKVNRYGQNKITNVCWETKVKSGEELIITYKYQVYVPD